LKLRVQVKVSASARKLAGLRERPPGQTVRKAKY
jgi:hypothetical protein